MIEIENTPINEIPFMAKSPLFRKLAAIEDIRTLSKEEHDMYDESIKVMRDNLACYNTAKNEGRAEGRAEGIISVACNMLAAGVPVSTICQCTGLSEEEIKNLAKD